jgi:hypothetical protein
MLFLGKSEKEKWPEAGSEYISGRTGSLRDPAGNVL